MEPEQGRLAISSSWGLSELVQIRCFATAPECVLGFFHGKNKCGLTLLGLLDISKLMLDKRHQCTSIVPFLPGSNKERHPASPTIFRYAPFKNET